MSFCGENELIDAGGGRTRLRYSGWTEGGRWWSKLLAPIGMLFASLQARGFHRELKRLAEREARALALDLYHREHHGANHGRGSRATGDRSRTRSPVE
jgi:hypothetical protein